MRLLSFFVVLSCMSGMGLAQAADYALDPNHTNARFEISHFGTSTNHGGFYMLEGKMQFDEQAKSGSVAVDIPVKSLQTGNKEFDKHVLGSDILNAEQFPLIQFQSSKWHFEGNKPAKIDGKLTMLGKTQNITLNVDHFNCYDNPMRKARVCGGDLSVKIDRTLWGLDYLLKPMGAEVLLRIQAEAIPE